MSPLPKLRPRKAPQQDRSKVTVDAILDAAAELLERRGYVRMTTNSVAKRAGVSVGSLYQYFPSKEALIVGLLGRYTEEVEASMHRRFSELEKRDLREFIRGMVQDAF